MTNESKNIETSDLLYRIIDFIEFSTREMEKEDIRIKEKINQKGENILKEIRELLPEMNNISAEIKNKITKYLLGIDDIDNM